MSSYRSRLVLFIGLWLAVSYWYVKPATLCAQNVSGTILGQIQDQQGAAIGKVEVTAKSLDTGAVRTAIADDGGEYRITSVPAGSYEVTATVAGFKTEVRSGISVTVGADLAVNFSLTLGAVTEKVEVTAEAAQVDTSSSALGGFVNSETIRELPLNGRDWLQLALLQPGVAFNTGQSQGDFKRIPKGNGQAFSISGGRQSDNAYRIDGLIINDYANDGPGSTLRVNMGVDAIREFSVLTNTYSAEYGRGSGGVINAITKSGTNQIHGSAYYFHRNSALDARNFFDQAIPPFRRHQYGGAVGGPIKKDKTFFFANYEALHEIKSLSSSADTLAASVHNGILCANTACTSTTQIPINQKLLPYLALYPLPNGPITGNTGKFVFGASRLGDENYVVGKIDHYFSPATTLSGSYTYDNAKVFSPDGFNLKTINGPSRRQNEVLNLQHIFSPNLINNIRGGVARSYAANLESSTTPAFANRSLGFFPGAILGFFSISGVGTLEGTGATGANIFAHTVPQVADDLSWTKGRHNIRAGFSFERIISNMVSQQTPNGGWQFGSIQGFLQGAADSYVQDFPGTDAVRGQRQSIVAGYIQDDFRILPNLTLNLGVRYEIGTVLTEVNGKLANLRHITDAKTTVGDPYWNNPTLKDFEPRVGFAWDPFKNGKTAVRGGFGMFDILPQVYLLQGRIVRTPPFFLQGNVASPPVSSFPNQISPLLTLSTLATGAMEFNPRRSYRAQWNLNIQRQLTRSLALSAGYVGASGVHLFHTVDGDNDQVPPSLVHFDTGLDSYIFPIPAAGQPIQRINPNFGQIRSTYSSGHSSYHAMQANLVQRPIHGLSYQIAYTWSKSMDDGSTTYTDTESSNTIGQSYAFCQVCNRGVSDFNIPHNFVANFLYDLPVPAAVKTRAFANTVFGGWQVGGIYTRQSGAPFSLRLSNDQALTGDIKAASRTGGSQRPQLSNAPGCSNPVTGNINNYVNTSCFTYPRLGQLGNEGRNVLTMPTFRDLDFSVFKNQNLWGEKLKMQFRAEMFNILNNTNLQAQVQAIFDGKGQIITNVGTPLAPTINTSRQIQFGLRLLF